jgi:glycoside/pentoside/hexuronide:cation symporter, GPH family
MDKAGTESPNSQAYTASNKTIHLWAIGAMADYMLYVPFNALIGPIFTTGFILDPRWVGWAVSLPRILDGLIDPAIGHLSDITHTRWGRRRPFILGAALLGAMAVAAMWWASPSWTAHAQFTWLLICSVLLFICYGTYSMTHVAFGYELSDDYNYRTKVAAIRAFYFSLAALGGGGIYWLALRPFFGGEITGIRWISAAMAGIILVTALIPVLTCKERFQNANRRHVNLWQALRTTLQMRSFVVILLLRVAQTLGTSLYGAMSFYIGVYSVCGGNKSLYTGSFAFIGGVAGVLFSLVMMPLAAGVSRRLGKRRGIIVSYGALFLSALLLPLFARPGHPYLLLTHSLLFLPANALLTMFMTSVMPDICDIDELSSGERREGLFSAVMSFVSKLENSLIILIGGYLVAFTGFDGHLAQQPRAVLEKLRWFGFTPNIAFSGVAFAIAWFVPITQQMMDDVRSRLVTRRTADNNK